MPLMNVTAEISGQSPWRATTSSAPRPFWTVIIVARGQRPARRAALRSRSSALQAKIPTSKLGQLGGVGGARTAARAARACR